MGSMGRPSRFSPEVRERAVRMVEEHREAHASEWAVLQSVAPKLGCTAETLRKWVRQAQRDAGHRPHSTADRGRLSVGERHPKPSTNCYSHASEDVLRRPLEPGQYLSMRYTDRLVDAGIAPSVGSQGDAYDNALAESVIGLYKTEVIRRKGPWRTLEAVEFATLTWVDWFNTRRLLGSLGDIPPAEFEAQYYEQAEVA